MKKIPLTQGKYALVDDADYERVSQYKWHYAQGYAVRSVYRGYKKSPGVQHIQRLIMGEPEGLFVDHINGDPLDNQQSNLRTCTHAQNVCNSGAQKNNKSGYKGVSKDGNAYRAFIYVNGRNVGLGRHATPQAASEAYKEASLKYHGEFSYINGVGE